MALKYQENSRYQDEIQLILEEHAQWFHQLLPFLFYPENNEALEKLSKPTSFAKWVVEANRDEALQPELVERLTALHTDLFKSSDTLTHGVKETLSAPEHKNFQGFMAVYEAFIFGMYRLERDLLAEGNGYDPLTGLRSGKLLEADVMRELDRFARQGRSFCLALVHVDGFDEMTAQHSKTEMQGYLRLISDLMKLSIRSFDDAYYMGENEFVLCLKQTDVSGGIVALERLREEMEKQNVTVEGRGGEIKPLRLKCCVAEPFEGDNVSEVLENLRASLDEQELKGSDAVLQYQEISPLQRYVQEGSV